MDIVFCIRRCDQEHQCNRLPIQRIKIHAILNYHCCQSRFCYRIAFSMRNGDSFSDSCRTFFFSCIYLLSICFFIIDLFALYHEINDLVECFVFALWRCIQKNTSCIQQICDSHIIFPPVDKSFSLQHFSLLCLTPAVYILLLLPVWLPDIRKMHLRFPLRLPYGKHAHNPAFPSSLS